jgi:hypothetical protein
MRLQANWRRGEVRHRLDNRFELRREKGKPGLDSKSAEGDESLDIG